MEEPHGLQKSDGEAPPPCLGEGVSGRVCVSWVLEPVELGFIAAQSHTSIPDTVFGLEAQGGRWIGGRTKVCSQTWGGTAGNAHPSFEHFLWEKL